MTRPDLKDLLLDSDARTENLTPPRRADPAPDAPGCGVGWVYPPRHETSSQSCAALAPMAPSWIGLQAYRLSNSSFSAVTVGEIQAGIEITREQDEPKAKEIEAWLDRVLAAYGVLPMDAPAFREWARLMHRRSDTMSEDAMIAATAIVHRPYGGPLATQATSRSLVWNCTIPGRTVDHTGDAHPVPASALIYSQTARGRRSGVRPDQREPHSAEVKHGEEGDPHPRQLARRSAHPSGDEGRAHRDRRAASADSIPTPTRCRATSLSRRSGRSSTSAAS